jgi:hypothetical protein
MILRLFLRDFRNTEDLHRFCEHRGICIKRGVDVQPLKPGTFFNLRGDSPEAPFGNGIDRETEQLP